MTTSTDHKQSFNLSRWAIGHPSIARFLFGLILITGVLGLMRMGQKEDPDFTFRVMVVQAIWPGASIQDMEDQVVNKIERKLQETPHLDFVRSYTRAGSAIITLQARAIPLRPRLPMPSIRCARRSAISPASCQQGLLGPGFNDELRRYVRHPAFAERRGLRLSGAEEVRYPGARHAAHHPGVEKAVIIGGPAAKDLYRHFLRCARIARADAGRRAERHQGTEQCRSGRFRRYRHALRAHLGRGRGHPAVRYPRTAAALRQ